MNEHESYSEEKAAYLLNHLELILESDPLIDEVGFIHPSQFVTLNEEIGQSVPSADDISTTLWSKDHKLGISTHALLPLFKAAKREFVDAVRRYKALSDQCGENGVGNSPCTVSSSHSSVESEVMKHSRVLLLLSCDFGTAWHSRKKIVLKMHSFSVFMDELHLSALVLSYSPKCEHAWSHRRWVIKSIAGKCSTLQEIVGKDSELVEKIAERSKMNYRAWNHRNWLVSHMSTDQVLHELTKSRNWAGLYVADNSCFHYRRRLMLRILEDSRHRQENGSTGHNVEIHQLLKEELEWNEMLIKRFIGREALWLHRRFLSLVLIKHFLSDQIGTSMDNDFGIFLDNELRLLSSCSTIPDSEFEDYQAQALHSTTYMLWLVKQVPEFDGIGVQEKLRTDKMKVLLNDACPDRSFLWDYLISEHCLKEN
nr:protein prenyltransferase alpha subunit repeat-containing protein 1-A isoform X1 [Ziziphus jujuba var. spinosa]